MQRAKLFITLSIDRIFDSVLLGGSSLLARFPCRVNDEGLRRASGGKRMVRQYNLDIRLSDIRRSVLFEACLAEFPQVEGGCNRVTAKELVL